QQTIEDAQLTAATIVAIDRFNGLIALRVPQASLIQLLEQQGRYDFSSNMVLDPIHKDYLVQKVQLTLRGIGNPASANTLDVSRALPLRQSTARSTSESPASEILWNASGLQQQSVARDIPTIRQTLNAYFTQCGASLDDSQWEAWEAALTHKLALL